MKNNYILVWLAFEILPFIAIGQVKQAASWVGGLTEYPTPQYGNFVARFEGQNMTIDTVPWGIPFESTVATISDSLGNLLFFTNGCNLYDTGGEVLGNGEGLNPGEIHDTYCEKMGYIVPKGAMILPIPDHPGEYWLLHLGAKYDFENLLHFGPFYATKVVAVGNTWQATQKNIPVLSGNIESFSVVRHGNGRDWWVFLPKLNSATIEIFRIDPMGIHYGGAYDTGFLLKGKRPGFSTFSPDGTKFARLHCETGIALVDFDRCSGVLSNSHLLTPPRPLVRGGGIAFSDDGNTLFAMAQSQIYKIDLQSASMAWDLLVNLYDEYTWGTTLGTTQVGPNENIYISPISRSTYWNALVKQADGAYAFEFQSVVLPVHQVRSMPNFPNFGLYDFSGTACDSLGIDAPVNSVISRPSSEALQFTLYPNPTVDAVIVGWKGIDAIGWQAINSTGQVVREGRFDHIYDQFDLSISIVGLPTGSYTFRLVTDNGSAIAKPFLVLPP